MVGVGSGALAGDARMMGIAPEERTARFESAFAAFQALLRHDQAVSLEEPGFTLKNARLQIPSYTRPHPPLYIASSFSGAGLTLAARSRTGLLLLGVGTGAGRRFREAAVAHARAGQPLDRTRTLLILNMHVGQSRRAAFEAIRAGAEAEQYEYWTGTIGMPAPAYARADHLDRMTELGQLVAGSPGECVDALHRLLADTGPVGGLLIAAREWADLDETRESYVRFIRDVAPALVGTRVTTQVA